MFCAAMATVNRSFAVCMAAGVTGGLGKAGLLVNPLITAPAISSMV